MHVGGEFHVTLGRSTRRVYPTDFRPDGVPVVTISQRVGVIRRHFEALCSTGLSVPCCPSFLGLAVCFVGFEHDRPQPNASMAFDRFMRFQDTSTAVVTIPGHLNQPW